MSTLCASTPRAISYSAESNSARKFGRLTPWRLLWDVKMRLRQTSELWVKIAPIVPHECFKDVLAIVQSAQALEMVKSWVMRFAKYRMRAQYEIAHSLDARSLNARNIVLLILVKIIRIVQKFHKFLKI